MLEIRLAGENSIIVYFADKASEQLLDQIRFYSELLQQELADWLIDIVPSYTSLLLSYRIDKVSHKAFCRRVSYLIESNSVNNKAPTGKRLQIPVFYDFSVGPDLETLLIEKQLDLEQFIMLHSRQRYRVYAIGFSPNFAFLGDVDAKLEMPRLKRPRLAIPAGSVAIADRQTAIYPITSSGGWNIIGQTPWNLSLTESDKKQQFAIGDEVHFMPISRDEFLAAGGKL